MKQLILSITLLLLLPIVGLSQEQIPNGDFENWTDQGDYDDPNGWGTLNFLTQFGGPELVIKTDTASSGNYACEMISGEFAGSPTAGFAFTGTIQPTSYGVPFHSLPTRVQFDYKAFPKGTDSCYFVLSLSHWDTANNKRDSIGYAEVFFDKTVSEFTMVDIPIFYALTGITPDTLGIFMSSSQDTANIVVGSRFIVDNIRLSYFPVGIDAPYESELTFYPNPASSSVTFNTTEDLAIEVYNTSGQNIQSAEGRTISVATLPKGIYYLHIRGKQTNNIYKTQKLIIK